MGYYAGKPIESVVYCLMKHWDMNAIVLGKQARRPSFVKPKNVTNYGHYVILTM